MSDSGIPQKKYLAIAKILRPWGVLGHAKCLAYNPETQIFLRTQEVFLKNPTQDKILKIEQARPHGKYWVLKFRGYSNPELVSELRNQEIYILRSDLPDLKKGEIYLSDLEGLAVFSFQKKILGKVQGFQRVGDSDVILVGKNRTEAVWVPFRQEFIAETSLEKKEIHLTEFSAELF